MSGRPELQLDWCSHAAAKYAVEHWHYSKSLRLFPHVALGVWEDGAFKGAIVFARGANRHLGRPYHLRDVEIAECIRIALTEHRSPVSRMLAIAVRLLTQKEPGLRLLVSFADMNQGHCGGIYQAAGWIYTGQVASGPLYQLRDGTVRHRREVSRSGVKPYFGRPRRVPRIADCTKVAQLPKHRYLYPLDAAMRAQIAPLAQPYPKRATSILADAPTDQAGESGAAPTVALAGSEG